MNPHQLPSPGEKLLDHVAHWVPDMDAAGETLVRVIAGYGLAADDSERARAMAEGTRGAVIHDLGANRFAASVPPCAGGTLLFSSTGILDQAP